jgi:hypothetical protein
VGAVNSCGFHSMIPSALQARVVALKPRRATVEWQLTSIPAHDQEPVRHAFGLAEFLLERQKKAAVASS